MSAVLAALLPIFALIAGGWAMRRWRFVEDAFWRPAERLNYFLMFPALLFHNVATASLQEIAVPRLAAVLLLPLLAVCLVLLSLRRWLQVEGKGFSSVWQGGLRFNAYVAIAAAASLWGREGVTAAALMIALLVPVNNLLSIFALTRWAGARRGAAETVLAVLGNPLILACALGAVANLLGGVPPLVEPLLRILGQASLPLGLLAVGAGLELGALHGQDRALAASVAAKLVLLPFLTALLCRALGLDGVLASVAILFHALPTAPSAYILARQLGGDAPLMAAILTVQTVASVVTVPMILTLIS